MIRNPFSRKPKTPVDQALDAFDSVRSEAAQYAATIRDTAAEIADTLTEIGPPSAPKRKLPVIAAVAAAGLGIVYLAKSRAAGSAPGPVPEVPGPPAAAATETAARTTAPTPPEGAAAPTPAKPGDSEEPKEPKAATAESNGEPSEPKSRDHRERRRRRRGGEGLGPTPLRCAAAPS